MPVTDGWLLPDVTKSARLWALGTRAVIFMVSACSKVWLGWFNKTVIHRKSTLLAAVNERPTQKPLITVSNHFSLIDDPLLAYMLPWRNLLRPDSMRWLPGAKDVCFKTYTSSLFFQLGRVIPVVRGDGVYQQCMDFSVDQLNQGGWVHLYPEGKINTTKELMRLKWGVGRLVCDCRVSPMVLPYWHLGMDSVLPNQTPYVLQARKKVTVVIGEPMDFQADLDTLRGQGKTDEEIRKFVTDKIQEQMGVLREEAENLHSKNVSWKDVVS